MAIISVVMTSYNHKEYIGLAIESILNQTFSNFEFIIVDDNSTDGSQEVIKKYEDIDNRIKAIYRKENFGNYVSATNFAASLATTDLIIFSQCDDYAEPTQLEELYKVHLNNPQCKVIYSCSNLVDNTGKHLMYDYDIRERKFKNHCAQDTIIGKEMMLFFLLQSCVIPNLSAAMIKRELFESLSGLSSNYVVLADWDFWIRSTSITDFYYIRKSLNNFRQHDTTIRNTIKIGKQLDELYMMMNNAKKNLSLKRKIYANICIGHIFINFVSHLFHQNKTVFFILLFNSIKVSLFEPFIIAFLVLKNKFIEIFK